MRNRVVRLLCLVTFGWMLSGCEDAKLEIDTEYPEIDLTASDAFPRQCGYVKRGEKIIFRATLKDNVQLGSVSVDVHHNFDKHTHSTEVQECNFDPVKVPSNPFLYIKSYPIPKGQKSYTIEQEIEVPAGIDPGDYHFMIRLTDQEGWQTMRGLSIKIL